MATIERGEGVNEVADEVDIRGVHLQVRYTSYPDSQQEQNDRRERLIKLSRDTTIASKRLIFLLHRFPSSSESEGEDIMTEAQSQMQSIHANFHSMSADLMNHDYYKYHRAFSPGVQEYLEAVLFKEYLQTKTLLTLEKAQSDIKESDAEGREFIITHMDYLLGIADFTGELMRLCINSVALGQHEEVDLHLKFLPFLPMSINDRELGKKYEVMKQSLIKVENVVFNVTVRGTEYPKEMILDRANDDGQPMEE
ncbi:translin-associated protein X-like isoform 2 [Planoprotostelium fungivorum]|uniref:Translin-associated protein X-like isoform 2 n=1 Tax=Planoprotostelium fungivorum TaxID=1890364 RepID=A0A2P6NNK0_9EUKA|nr:translin-associated protein X-like isoform 2 [Planoprotostelium fungivorum]